MSCNRDLRGQRWNILISRYPTVLCMLIRWIHVVCKQCVLRLEWNGIKWGSNNRINWCNRMVNQYISNKKWINMIGGNDLLPQRNIYRKITNRWVN